MHPERETLTHNFSCSGGLGAVSIKSMSGYMGHVVHFVAFVE
jgi:hypothetical protein